MANTRLTEQLELFLTKTRRVLLRAKAVNKHELVSFDEEAHSLLSTLEGYTTARATRARKTSTLATRAAEPFTITWKVTGHRQHVAGWEALSNATGYALSSLRVMLSKGRGMTNIKLDDPTTNLEDIAEVRRVNYTPGYGRPAHPEPLEPS